MKGKIASDKVAIYIRWSTEDQGQGHTLEIQRESCRYYCLSQGWIARDELTFIDDGHSGSTLERPALSRLRKAVQAGEVDCVIVYKLDRLSRNVKDIINLVLDEWEEACCVRSTQEPVDTTSDAGRMFFTMLGSFADFERSTIKTRTWSGKRKNAEKGKNPGMAYPFGYMKAEDGGWAICEDEATMVRRIFAAYIRGESCHTITAALNQEGCRTRAGFAWSDASVARIIRSPIYIGELVYNKKNYAQKKKVGRVQHKDPSEVITVDNAAPPIIDRETWDVVRRIAAERPRPDRGKSPSTHSSNYLLSGLARCACGHLWIARPYDLGKGYHYYGCAGAKSKGAAFCQAGMIPVADLDAFVLDKVRDTWPIKGEFRREMFDSLSRRLAEFESRVKGLKQRLTALEGAQERFKSDYKAGRITGEVYMDLTKDGRSEKEALLAALQKTQAERQEIESSQLDLDQASAWYAKLDGWDSLTLADKQQILRMLIQEIRVIRPRGRKQEISVHIEWRLSPPATSA